MLEGQFFMKKIRGLYRLALFAISASLLILWMMLARLLWGDDMRHLMHLRQRWLLWLLPRLGVRLHLKGAPPNFPCILMGNHRSYLDPVLLASQLLGYPVSKAEVANWPIIGYGAQVSGVLFLKRESATSRKRTLDGIAEKLRAGFPVMLYPEGTSHSQPSTMAFKLGGFRAAAAEGVPVVPVAVEYRSAEDYWVGNDTFLPHFISRFGEKEMHVWLHFGPKIEGEDGAELLTQTRDWIDVELRSIQVGLSKSPSGF